MKEINIAKTLGMKRREKGITQEDVAAYIGVSKASVSKWETGQSYPDILFLPRLATYFNISIDELIGYVPQMTKKDIKKLYHQISSSFAHEPFDDVMKKCKYTIKKYYSCFPLLFQMAVLLVNHHMLASNEEDKREILNEAAKLCIRIREESDDVWLGRNASSFEAVCYIMLQQPQDVIDLLGEEIRPMNTGYEVMAQAYQMLNNTSKANEVTQVGMYQYLLALMGATPAYLMLNANDHERVEEVLHRSLAVAEIYHMEELHPNTMAQIYLTAAQLYGSLKNRNKSLHMLQKYSDVCTKKFFPFSLHGDSYFDQIEGWFEDFDLGSRAPRSEILIKESMYQGVCLNPAFSFLKDQPQYKNILEALELNIGSE